MKIDIKKHKKNIAIGTLGAALILSSGLVVVSAAEHEREGKHDRGEHGEAMHEFHEAAVEGDYAEYKELIEEGELPDRMSGFSEAEFAQIGEMITLHKAGDKEGAEAIRDSLGLPEHKAGQRRMHKQFKNVTFEDWQNRLEEKGVDTEKLTQETFDAFTAARGDREAMTTLHESLGIEAPEKRGDRAQKGEKLQRLLESDYEQWSENAAERGMNEQQITPEVFAGLQQAATLFEAGDKDGAKTVLDELGIEKPEGLHKKDGSRRGNRVDKQGR